MNNEVEELEVIIKKIRYKDIVWIPEPQKQGHHINKHPKQNYFVKWLHKNKQVGDLFTLDDFYRVYPKHKEDVGCKDRVEKALSKMISDKEIQQLHTGEFKVLKDGKENE